MSPQITLKITHMKQIDLSKFNLNKNFIEYNELFFENSLEKITLSWSTKMPVVMVLETVTESGTRVWQGEKRFEVGKTEYERVMT